MRQSSHSALPVQLKALVKNAWAVQGVRSNGRLFPVLNINMEIKSIVYRELDGPEDLQREMRLVTCVSLSCVSHPVASVELVNGLASVTSSQFTSAILQRMLINERFYSNSFTVEEFLK